MFGVVRIALGGWILLLPVIQDAGFRDPVGDPLRDARRQRARRRGCRRPRRPAATCARRLERPARGGRFIREGTTDREPRQGRSRPARGRGRGAAALAELHRPRPAPRPGRRGGGTRRRQGEAGPEGRRVLHAADDAEGQARRARVGAQAHGPRRARAGPSRNALLLYRSTGLDGGRIAVSGSLALPKGKPPKGGWPLITYAHGTTGAADACAPSRGYDAGKPRVLRLPAARTLAQGRLRRGAHGLRGSRHARHAPLPARHLGGPQRARRRARRPGVRPAEDLEAGQLSPATRRAATPRSTPPRSRPTGRRS